MDAILYDKIGKEAQRLSEYLLGTYPQETLTNQAVASFDDGADDIPIKQMVVAVDPLQDLHGYDHPWPAGGGKNLINVADTSSGSSGDIVNLDDLSLPAGTYTLSLWLQAENGACQIDFMNGSTNVGTATKNYSGLSSGGQFYITVTASDTASKVLLYCNRAYVAKNIMLESGSSATAFAPYSNICPISGWTGAKVGVAGKNLVDFDIPYTTESSGATNHFATHFVLPKVGEYIRCYGKCSDGTVLSDIAIVWLNSSNQQVWNIGSNRAFEVPKNISNVTAIRIYTPATYAGKKVTELQVEYVADESGTVTAYEPYNNGSAQYPITFPSEAGTVYGGTLTINQDGSGELVVEKAKITITSLSMNETNSFFAIPSIQYKANQFTVISDKTKSASNATDVGVFINVSGSIRLNTANQYASASDCITAFGGSFDVVAELATPVTYTLAPGQVKTLLGVNNVWADTGNIKKLTYRADLGLFMAKLTMPQEDDFTANVNIPSGKYFMVGSNIYIAIQAIAQGATITPGTNCTAISLAEALNSLNQ